MKGIKDGVHYEYRETMPYKREPEFLEVSPKGGGISELFVLHETTAVLRRLFIMAEKLNMHLVVNSHPYV